MTDFNLADYANRLLAGPERKLTAAHLDTDAPRTPLTVGSNPHCVRCGTTFCTCNKVTVGIDHLDTLREYVDAVTPQADSLSPDWWSREFPKLDPSLVEISIPVTLGYYETIALRRHFRRPGSPGGVRPFTTVELQLAALLAVNAWIAGIVDQELTDEEKREAAGLDPVECACDYDFREGEYVRSDNGCPLHDQEDE